MDGQDFKRVIQGAFVPFLIRLGFVSSEVDVSGRLYDATFTSPNHAVSISYEPGDDVFEVLIFIRQNGRLSDIDDRSTTQRLSDLNKRYMNLVTPSDRKRNDLEFQGIAARDAVERRLLKYASELQLVLPMYLDDFHSGKSSPGIPQP